MSAVDILAIVATTLAVLSLCYLAVATWRAIVFRRQCRHVRVADELPSVTVLKPICGKDPELLENLRSFCDQDYPVFQVVFGVRDKDDPAVPVIRQIIDEFPRHDVSLVIDDRVIGSNLKISNLANMFSVAKHDILLIADSDMRVGRDYLRKIVRPFETANVGATTCLYGGVSSGGVASRLGAMFINDWFIPSALIPLSFGRPRYCFGATMAVRRKTLEAFGGFAALAGNLADDYMLGKLVRDQGQEIALVPYVVQNFVEEPDLKGLFLHELRWARTIRSVQPLGYAFTFLTDSLVLAGIAAALAAFSPVAATTAYSVLFLTIACRLLLHFVNRRAIERRDPGSAWLIPIRDILTFLIRTVSFMGSGVRWRKQDFVVQSGGQLEIVN
ncbi:MAG: bacteriohopanetetrol glucosamine biosynthesis glycosyltransferase HpnI [Alphaproteobacteria bacterium]|nr:bacteriohopanetetrol glucosamine biosynthesis glycosyltransferase HpnI [Alphaproteobacteria bacterium]